MTPEEQAILDAWNNPGIRPEWHKTWQKTLAVNWPTLHRAILNLQFKQIELGATDDQKK